MTLPDMTGSTKFQDKHTHSHCTDAGLYGINHENALIHNPVKLKHDYCDYSASSLWQATITCC